VRTQTRESRDKPILNAFCRVAPSERFSVLAIREAFFFWRAMVFKVRTCSGVHARRFVAFLAIKQTPDFDRGYLVAPHVSNNNKESLGVWINCISLAFKSLRLTGSNVTIQGLQRVKYKLAKVASSQTTVSSRHRWTKENF
jgi:hypothetical protein